MIIYHTLPRSLPVTGLSIGTFDGVHLGHRALIAELKKRASFSTLITFSNHPLEILNPSSAPKLLTPIDEKIALLQSCGVDAIIAIPFTKELAAISYEAFLAPFQLTHLVLGEGDAFGKNREGNRENLQLLSQQRHFELVYVEKKLLQGAPISSKRIRAALADQDWLTLEQLLGRKQITYV